MQRLAKKMLTTLFMLLTLPALAQATTYWQVTRSASPATAVTALVAPVDAAKYTTSGNATYVIASSENLATSYLEYTLGAPPAGYALLNVKVDGVVASPVAGKYRVTRGSSATHSIVANFVAAQYTITTSPAAGGTIDPSRIAASFPQTVAIVPNAGYRLDDVKLNGSSLSSTDLATVKANRALTLTAVGSYTIVPSFAVEPVLTARIGNTSQSATLGMTLPLNGSVTSNVPTAYQWTVSPADGGSFGTPNAATTSFTASKTSTVTLTATGGGLTSSSSVTVTVLSAASYGSNSCLSCHSSDSSSIAGSAVLAAAFQRSLHYTQTSSVDSSCSGCHNPDGTLQHHFDPAPVNACLRCHLNAQGLVANHPLDIGSNSCTSCHNSHSLAATVPNLTGLPHFNNQTSGRYPASFVSSKASCADCHFEGTLNKTVRQQWYTSGHARVTDLPFTAYDFKTRSGCVQCHTTTGFIAYSTGKVTAAWGVASDKTKEVVTCAACHKEISTGLLRSVSPVRPYADAPSYQNRNLGKSNLCLDCHSGLTTGNAILSKVGSANFAVQAFIPPHYLAAGGTLHGKAGYHFPGQAYAFYSSNSHRGIGIGNNAATGTAGPCIACHKNDNGHTFQAVAGALCANCHNSSMPAGTLALDKASYANGLSILNAMLADRGFVYSANYPYFTNTNWGSDQAGANVMGAAYNYVLLLKEPGAYAHNAAYAKELIVDSIDCVYNNGVVTGSIDAALAYLVGKGAISQEAADGLKGYKSTSSCASCHADQRIDYSSGSHPAHLAQGVSCSACHAATAASNTSLVPGSVAHVNGVTDVVLQGGGSYSGGLAGNCSNVYCHSDGIGAFQQPVWGSGKLSCKSCHPVLGGSHAAHVGNLFDQASFDSYTGNYSTAASYRFGCANCHPIGLSGHRDGKIDLSLAPDPNAGSLRNLNDPNTSGAGIGNTGSGITGTTRVRVVCSASYCHSNGWSNGTLTYASSPDWYNPGAYQGDRCAMCHGNSPNTATPGSPAHTVHTVGIHSLTVFSGSFGNLSTASTGNVGHGIASQSTTLNCNTCHSDTVTSSRNDANNLCTGCHVAHNNVLTIADKSRHLNGRVDISFANISVVSKAQLRPASFAAYTAAIWTRNGGNYKNGAQAFDTAKVKLKSAASWDGASCSNVACHMGQPVQWTNTNSPSYCALCHTAL